MEIYVVKAGDTLGTTAACRYISDKETDIGDFKMSQSLGQKFTPLKLLKFAFPSMVMMVFMSLYQVVDGIFISRLVGSRALSAANIVYPPISVLFAVGVMIATGGSALVSKELGENKEKEAREDFTFLVVAGLVCSLLLMGIVVCSGDALYYLLGANKELVGYCREYLVIVMYFAPAAMLQMIFQSFFVAAGKPHLGLAVTVLAGITNAVLDYVFMGIADMGIMGAALATGIGQVIPAVIGCIFFLQKNKELHFCRFVPDFAKLGQACFNGASEMVTNISNAVITYLFNIIMMKLIGEDGVAAITIILYSQFMFNSLYMGFSMGTAPVISFNYGAKNEEEVRKITKICKRFVIGSSIGVTILSFLLADFVTMVFVTRGSAVYDLTVEGFILFSISYLFSGYNIFTSSYFTALSDGKTSALISFSRTFVCIVASLMILPQLWGIYGVWLAIPLAELVTVGLCIVCRKRAVRK